MSGLDLPRVVCRLIAFREEADRGWRMVETTLTKETLRPALERLGIAAIEVRYAMECLTKSSPEGVNMGTPCPGARGRQGPLRGHQ